MMTLTRASTSPETRAPRRARVDGDVARTPEPSTSTRARDSDEESNDDDDDRSPQMKDGANDDSRARGENDAARTVNARTVMARDVSRDRAHVVDGDGGSWSAARVRRAALEHDGACAMRVRERDADGRTRERVVVARVRVLTGRAGSGGDEEEDDEEDEGKESRDGAARAHDSRMIRVHVSCDDDPFFYHAMEVREEDYGRLRAEQRLVVGFDEFPRALVRLLRACEDGDATETPTTATRKSVTHCVLDVTRGKKGNGEATSALSVVETSDFNQFTHVRLKFKPASDRAAKRILAGLLLDARERERELARFESLYEESRAMVERARAESLDARVELAEASATGKREILDELERQRTRYEDEKREMSARVDEAIRAKNEMEREKLASQGKVSELATKLGLLEGDVAITRRELTRVREENAALDAEIHERDKAHSARALRVEWLEKQLGDKEEVIDLLRSRLDAGEEHKVALASSWEQTRVALARAEERVAASASEINKGNAIIEELQSDIRSLKSKMKIQTAVIKRQEALLDERGAAALAVAGERAERSLETRELVDQNRQLTERNQTLDAELTDARATLESNKRVIDWLNTELSAASLRRGSAPPPTPPTPAVAAPRSPLIDLSSPTRA